MVLHRFPSQLLGRGSMLLRSEVTLRVISSSGDTTFVQGKIIEIIAFHINTSSLNPQHVTLTNGALFSITYC